VEKKIPRDIEKIVHVPVDKVVEIVIDEVEEVPVFRNKQVVNEVLMTKPHRPSTRKVKSDTQGRDSINRLDKQRHIISELKSTIAKLKIEQTNIHSKLHIMTSRYELDYTSQNEVLRKRIADLEKALVEIDEGKIRHSLLT